MLMVTNKYLIQIRTLNEVYVNSSRGETFTRVTTWKETLDLLICHSNRL